MPPLLGIRQGLQALFIDHAEAVFAAYGAIQDAAAPLEHCISQVLSSDDRHLLEALNGLLNAYRQSLSRLKPEQEIDAACDVINQRPDDESAVTQLEDNFANWIATCAPLVAFSAHQSSQ